MFLWEWNKANSLRAEAERLAKDGRMGVATLAMRLAVDMIQLTWDIVCTVDNAPRAHQLWDEWNQWIKDPEKNPRILAQIAEAVPLSATLRARALWAEWQKLRLGSTPTGQSATDGRVLAPKAQTGIARGEAPGRENKRCLIALKGRAAIAW